MPEVVLPSDRYTAETHLEALGNVIDRYAEEEEPIHYKKAAIDMSEPTASSCLKYFSDIELISSEKAGIYVPSQPALNYFRKVGSAKEEAVVDIFHILEEDDVFQEAVFLVKNKSVDKEELSKNIAGQLNIDKEDLSRIEKAINIFESLDLMSSDEENVVTVSKTVRPESGKDQSNDSDKERSSVDLEGGLPESLIEEFELPPGRGNPDNLLQICNVLSSGGDWTIDEIAEQSELSVRSARGTVKYGEQLGIFEQKGEAWRLTPDGFDLGFEGELSDSAKTIIEQGLVNYPEYAALIVRVFEEHEDKIEASGSITKDIVTREIRTFFEIIDVNDRTVNSSISTFLATIEAAGYGSYIVGRGGKQTRLEVEDIGSFRDLVVKSKNGLGITMASSDDIQDTTKPDEVSEGTESSPDETSETPTSPEVDDGPPLKISSFRIQNFKNIQDSGIIPIHNVTTLIGKNESGKTSILEALASFNQDEEYDHTEICRNVDIGDKSETPIVTLIFQISEDTAEKFYPTLAEKEQFQFPIEIEVTKFANGSRSYCSTAERLFENELEPPIPEFVFYDEYDLISDRISVNQIGEEGDAKTFSNLLQIGDLEESDLTETIGLERDSAIAEAEEKIEQKINDIWSQKDFGISLKYEGDTGLINIYIQDEIKFNGETVNRDLTLPSQRSEGFRWFFSFYINILAESDDGSGYKILLLDDPAVQLHPEGKNDWLKTVEEIAGDEQIIYSSHSPYLIEKRRPYRIRTVEDQGKTGTKIHTDIFDADTGTLEPLRNALGVNHASSPFINQRQVLVEGPSEYYLLSAVSNYFENDLNRELIDWGKLAIMPVRGAPASIGKASWLESENIEYAILLDSDGEGEKVRDQIETHHEDITDERVVLLQKGDKLSDVVIEDLVSPELYVEAFNEEYEDFTSEVTEEFKPVEVESVEDGDWKIGEETYDGTRLDKILESILEDQEVAEILEKNESEIELRKRQISERIAEKVNDGEVEEGMFSDFNWVFAKLRRATNLTNS